MPVTSAAPRAPSGYAPISGGAASPPISRPAPPPPVASSPAVAPSEPTPQVSKVPVFGTVFRIGAGIGKGLASTITGITGLGEQYGALPSGTTQSFKDTLTKAGFGDPVGVSEQFGAIAEGVGEFVVGGEAIDTLKSLPLISRALNFYKYGNLGFDILKGSSLFAGKEYISGGTGGQIMKAGLEGAIPFGIVSEIPAKSVLAKLGRGALAGVSEAALSKTFGETDKQTIMNSALSTGLVALPPIINDTVLKTGLLNKAFDRISTLVPSLRGYFNPTRIADESVLNLFEKRQAAINNGRFATKAMQERFVNDVPNVKRREIIHRALDNPDAYLPQLNAKEKDWFQNLQNYYQSSGNLLKDKELIDGIVDNYAPRIVDIPGSRSNFRAARSTISELDKFGNVVVSKKYPSIDDLEAAGLKLKTYDAAEIFGAHSLAVNEAVFNKELMEELRGVKTSDGRPAYFRFGDRTFKPSDGGRELVGSAKYLGLAPIGKEEKGRFYNSQTGKEYFSAGEAKIPADYRSAENVPRTLDFIRFHPDVKPITEAQYSVGRGATAISRIYGRTMQFIRRVKFLSPNVHFFNLLRNEMSVKSIGQLLPSIIEANKELLTNPEFQKRLTDSGIELFRLSSIANDSFETIGTRKFALPKGLDKVFGKTIGGLFNLSDKFLFTYTGDGVNASIAKSFYDILGDNPNLSVKQINGIVGDIANNLSGQVPKYSIGEGERTLSKILLAPRWNISNFRIYLRNLGVGFPNSWTPGMVSAATETYQKATMAAFSRLFLFSQYVNYSVTKQLTGKGDFTWNNPISSPLDIVKKISPVIWINKQNGKYYTLNPYGYLSDAIKVLRSAITRDPSDLFDMVNNKIHPLLKEAAQQTANTDFFTHQEIRKKWMVYSDNWISENVLASLEHAGIEFSPIGSASVFHIGKQAAGTDVVPEATRALGLSVSTISPTQKFFDIKEIRSEIRKAQKEGDAGRVKDLENILISREKSQ